jgi:hypothetical protein
VKARPVSFKIYLSRSFGLVLKLLTNHCYPRRKGPAVTFLYLFGTRSEYLINHVSAPLTAGDVALNVEYS